MWNVPNDTEEKETYNETCEKKSSEICFEMSYYRIPYIDLILNKMYIL